MGYTIPEDLRYSKEHEWIKIEGDTAIIGITDYAQSELSDIVYIEVSSPGTKIEAMNPIGTIEAVKTVSDLFSPLSGELMEFNENLKDNPGIINEDPYGEGWILKLRISNPEEINNLLTKEQYEELIKA